MADDQLTISRPDPEVTTPSPAAAKVLSGEEEDRLDRQLRRQQQQQLMTEQQQNIRERHDIEAGKEREEAPMRRDLMSSLQRQSEMGTAATQRLMAQRQDVPEFKQPNIREDAFQWTAIAAAFGAIAGGLSRYHTTAALNAFGAAMQGFAQGKLEQFSQNYKIWEANAQRARDYNARMVEEYRAIMEDAKLDVDTKANMLKLVGSKWDDKLMVNAADARDIAQMENIINTQERIGDNYTRWTTTLGQHAKEVDDKIDAQLAAKGLKRDENGKIVRDPNATAAGKTWQKQAFEDWRDEYINANGHPPSAEEERQFGQTLTTVRSAQAMALQKFLQENPKAKANDVVAFTANLAGDIAAIRAAGNRAGQIAVSAEEADSTFQLAQQASARFPRGQYQPLNRLYQDVALAKGDPRFRQFMAANEAAVTAYGATMSRSGANTVSAQQRAHDVLDTADSAEAYAAGIQQLQQEVNQVRTAPARARGALMKNLGLVVESEPRETTTGGDTRSLSDDELRKKLGLP